MSYLNEKLIAIGVDVSTAEECIRFAAKLLQENGYIQEGYADAVVEREKVYPTGLMGKEISVAIPHTNNELVNKPAVCIIVPNRPVCFGMMGTKDQTVMCEVIIPLVIKDSEMQIPMLQKTMKLIQNSELLTKIRDSKNAAEAMACLKSLEEE